MSPLLFASKAIFLGKYCCLALTKLSQRSPTRRSWGQGRLALRSRGPTWGPQRGWLHGSLPTALRKDEKSGWQVTRWVVSRPTGPEPVPTGPGETTVLQPTPGLALPGTQIGGALARAPGCGTAGMCLLPTGVEAHPAHTSWATGYLPSLGLSFLLCQMEVRARLIS